MGRFFSRSGDIGSGLHVTFNEADGYFIVGSTVPEPSTYATLFGVLALAGAALRRRRTN